MSKSKLKILQQGNQNEEVVYAGLNLGAGRKIVAKFFSDGQSEPLPSVVINMPNISSVYDWGVEDGRKVRNLASSILCDALGVEPEDHHFIPTPLLVGFRKDFLSDVPSDVELEIGISTVKNWINIIERRLTERTYRSYE